MASMDYDKSFGRMLGVAYSFLYKRLAKNMKEGNLPITADQFRVMTHLWKEDGKTQQELAYLTFRDRANITRVMDILEREELVYRQTDPLDKRILRVFLTEKGKEIEAASGVCARRSVESALENVSLEDIKICQNVLAKIIKNLN